VAEPVVTDERLAEVLRAYAGMVGRVLADPERWLGLDEDPPPTAGFPARALDALRDRALGEQTPASASWSEVPVHSRVDWWVTRIGVSAGLAAAAPRFLGAVADRLPVQASLGAAAAGLAVCATAHEHARPDPDEWVPLLAKVLFDRELELPAGPVPDAEQSERALSDISEEGELGPVARLGKGAQRAARTLWRLARAFRELNELLDRRPRGGRLVRVLGKVPVVGVASGWLDERGGIRKAADETSGLLR
jgi:hypothetical protein